MTSKIVYENNNVSAKDYDIVQLVSVITELQSKVSHLETRVKKLEKKLEKPKFEKLYTLFEELDFLKFYNKFEKEHIDYETLKQLCKDGDLKELKSYISISLGEYLKFSKKIKEHFDFVSFDDN